jgi:hypothetical protein
VGASATRRSLTAEEQPNMQKPMFSYYRHVLVVRLPEVALSVRLVVEPL